MGEGTISRRDADELAACFAADAAGLFGYACVLVRGDRALAEDLVQAGFEAAARAWGMAMSASVVSPVFIGRKHEMASLAAPLRQAEGGEPAVVQRANLPAIR